jgi:hypothetical protein
MIGAVAKHPTTPDHLVGTLKRIGNKTLYTIVMKIKL